jgi:sodium/potassium-transporting ATPase subunit alpha
MDAAVGDPEKQALPPANAEEENIAQRAVAFPDNDIHEERRGTRPKGIEMKRELTQEDKELAEAIHKGKKGEKDFDSVDITEHKLAFGPLSEALKTSFDTKVPGQSHGLSTSEAKARYCLNLPFYSTSPESPFKDSRKTAPIS